MRILAVDDDEIILELLGGALEAYGYDSVELADCGENAIQVINNSAEKFECFMFDIQMPGMDGTELCRYVRQLEGYSETPIIMITAMNQKSYVDRAFLVGATDYVTKPFEMTELISRVKLADRLQMQTKQAQAARDNAEATMEVVFEETLALPNIAGVVSPVVLRNYVNKVLSESGPKLQAIAIKIPELMQVHQGSSPSEFRYVVFDIAEVISEMMRGQNVFTSYFGSGIFLCFGPKEEMLDRKNITRALMSNLNDSQLVYSEEVKTSFSARVGSYCAPSVFQKMGPNELFGTAIDKIPDQKKGFGLHRLRALVEIIEEKLSV
jgi:CheY-like chemotaxis protein